MEVLTRARHAVESRLESLAESNQQQIGGKKMDCCEINRRENDEAVRGAHNAWEQCPSPREEKKPGAAPMMKADESTRFSPNPLRTFGVFRPDSGSGNQKASRIRASPPDANTSTPA